MAPGHGTGLYGAHSGYNAASQPASKQLDEREACKRAWDEVQYGKDPWDSTGLISCVSSTAT